MTATEHDDNPSQILDPLVVRARQRVGQVLREKWRLDVLLGVGGMAAVYAATHRNGSRVAVKILHPELGVSPEVRTRFMREGYVANAVGHDGVVHVADDDVAEDGAAFLVMTLLDGETVEERRQRHGGRLSEDEVLSIADQVLDVLVAAHAKGIVHRDIKPENVFLTRDGRVKVFDFGIARLREMSTASRATHTGHSMGTPSFMAPEQARALWDQVDGRSDTWSAGATMFALLSGKEVHSGRTANEVLIDAATKSAPPLESVLPEVSSTVARVVDGALAFERDRRWQDATTMQEAVRAAFHNRHGAPISTAPRLTLPSSVVNRTLASASVGPVSPRAPTTNGAVAATRLSVSAPYALPSLARLRRPSPIVIGVGGAVVAAAIGVGVLVSGARKSPASSAAGVTTMDLERPELSAPTALSSSQELPPAPPAPSKRTTVPVVAVTDLPTATAPPLETTKPTPKLAVPAPAPATPTPFEFLYSTPSSSPRVQVPAPPTPAATTAKTARPDCTPPYVHDPATGTKRWKAQCFQ